MRISMSSSSLMGPSVINLWLTLPKCGLLREVDDYISAPFPRFKVSALLQVLCRKFLAVCGMCAHVFAHNA